MKFNISKNWIMNNAHKEEGQSIDTGIPPVFPTPTPLASTAMEAATPRTDAEVYTVLRGTLNGDRPDEHECVSPDFARQLERELIAFQPLLAKVEGELEAMRKNRDECAAVFIMHRDHEKKLPNPECACPSCNLNRQLITLRADLAAKEAAMGAKSVQCEAQIGLSAKALTREQQFRAVVRNAAKATEELAAILDRFGNWEEGCFYYNKTAAPELVSSLEKIRSALASRADKGGAK